MEKFTIPSMDWSTPGDIHKRYKLFMQKCSLIFDGPLSNKPEGQKARLLLLWAGDKGLEIYNTARWEDEADKFKLKPIFEKFSRHTQGHRATKYYPRTSLDVLNKMTCPWKNF